MLEALRDEDLVNKIGGRFRLTALIQKRMIELLEGSHPLVEREPGMTDMELVIQEILTDKIAVDYEKSDLIDPKDEKGSG